jgi:hypothetical protein
MTQYKLTMYFKREIGGRLGFITAFLPMKQKVFIYNAASLKEAEEIANNTGLDQGLEPDAIKLEKIEKTKGKKK